jgi:hypothetical protein
MTHSYGNDNETVENLSIVEFIAIFVGFILFLTFLEYILNHCRPTQRDNQSEATVLSDDDISDKNESQYEQV